MLLRRRRLQNGKIRRPAAKKIHTVSGHSAWVKLWRSSRSERRQFGGILSAPMITATKILAVDDEEFNLDIIEHHLRREGYEVVPAQDGLIALQRLEEHAGADLILLDRMMPNLDGMEFLKRIKDDARFKDIPVIMQTAAAAPDQILQGIQAGVYYYLTKPYDGPMLIGVVNAALDTLRTTKKLQTKVRGYDRQLGLLEVARFRFQTLEEAASLASYIANCFPEPERAVLGLHELLLNAVEHGNLGITYAEKSMLIRAGGWEAEIQRRLGLPAYRDKFACLTFEATPEAVIVHIKDAGAGFDWKRYLDFCPERATDPHGRGIATSRAISFDALDYLGCGNEVRCMVTLAAKKGMNGLEPAAGSSRSLPNPAPAEG
jgi:CheY-like chemotaxis protein